MVLLCKLRLTTEGQCKVQQHAGYAVYAAITWLSTVAMGQISCGCSSCKALAVPLDSPLWVQIVLEELQVAAAQQCGNREQGGGHVSHCLF
jgi:hypothetical protein